MATRIDIPNILINFLKKARYERLVREQEVDPNQLYATTDGNEKTEYGDLFGNIENQADLYNALYSSRIFTKAMCDDPRGYAIVKALKNRIEFDKTKVSLFFTEYHGPLDIDDNGIYDGREEQKALKSINVIDTNNAENFEMSIRFMASTPIEANQNLFTFTNQTYRSFQNSPSNFWVQLWSDAVAWDNIGVSDGDWLDYSLFIDYQNNTSTVKMCKGNTEVYNATFEYARILNNHLYIANYEGDALEKGLKIDLKYLNLKIDGNTIFECLKDFHREDTYPLYNITIPYIESRDGVKIVDVQYKDLVDQLYDLTGQGNYIIIDEANEEFRLPLPDLYSQLENKSSFILRKWED